MPYRFEIAYLYDDNTWDTECYELTEDEVMVEFLAKAPDGDSGGDIVDDGLLISWVHDKKLKPGMRRNPTVVMPAVYAVEGWVEE